MKLNKQNVKKNKLLKLKLLNSKIFEKKQLLENVSLQKLYYQLKKALQIVYWYHKNKKKIVFISDDLSTLKLLRKTPHTCILESNWEYGKLTNKLHYYDLVVLLNHNNVISKESFLSKTPLITLGAALDMLNKNYSYAIPGNFDLKKNSTRKIFFISLLKSVLKK